MKSSEQQDKAGCLHIPYSHLYKIRSTEMTEIRFSYQVITSFNVFKGTVATNNVNGGCLIICSEMLTLSVCNVMAEFRSKLIP
jgi:hypothetical protein